VEVIRQPAQAQSDTRERHWNRAGCMDESPAPDHNRLGIFLQAVMTGSPPSTTGTAVTASAIGATPDERERVVDLLQLRFADDRLSLDDFEQRVALAYQAKTAAELDALVADLAPVALTSAVPEHGRVAAVFSSNERNGPMTVPRQFEIVATFGNVALDLSDATFAEGTTEIRISAVLSSVELTLPLGVHVECTGESIFGTFDCKAASVAGYPAYTDRVVRIAGRSIFASVEIGAQPSGSMRLPHDSPRRLS
jgi:hypothetical protein